MSGTDPHGDQPVRTAGPDPADAGAGVVLAHGRGARAEGMLDIARQLDVDGVAYLAPQAARATWYPNSFLAETDANQPHLDSALAFFGRTVDRLADAGLPADRILLGGFSQGACLATEYAARNAARYGGVVAFSGGLIGPEGTDFGYEGSMEGTPAFLGCSDIDPHIPVERVHETRDALAELGADVDERIYEGMAHTVNADELEAMRALVADLG